MERHQGTQELLHSKNIFYILYLTFFFFNLSCVLYEYCIYILRFSFCVKAESESSKIRYACMMTTKLNLLTDGTQNILVDQTYKSCCNMQSISYGSIKPRTSQSVVGHSRPLSH